jgi:hypothetical protein
MERAAEEGWTGLKQEHLGESAVSIVSIFVELGLALPQWKPEGIDRGIRHN